MSCPCGSAKTYEQCCEPFHSGEASPSTPEALMRSRYSAFAKKLGPYLEQTTDPQTAGQFDFKANQDWADRARFTKLEVLSSSEEGTKGFVEFKAHFESDGTAHVHHEKSRFRKQNGRWFYREGKVFES